MGVPEVRAALMGVAVYRHLLDTDVLAGFVRLLDLTLSDSTGEQSLSAYARFFQALKETGCRGLSDWLWDSLRYLDSPYGLACEQGRSDPALTAAARRDVAAFGLAAALPPEELLRPLYRRLPIDHFGPVLDAMPRWEPGEGVDFDALTRFYETNGCGRFAQYRAFRWEHGALVAVPHPDSPQPWELWGYTAQRRQVYDNAKALLEGRRVNHVLLYGDSGTGKSATVKSLLSLPGYEALRVIEMDKDHLEDIPALVRQLEPRPQKFVLFIDDLSFDADDAAYSQLKTILEGSLEKQRDNVVVYATSNRRNLVRQTFSDRAGDEVNLSETLAEKTSLAERFGERVAFLSLTPREFLQMVRDLSRLYGLDLDDDVLETRARQWELRHPGRTPRIARQFIAYELDRR